MSEQTTVLLADDHPGILNAVSKYLERAGLQVVGCAKDGDEAVRLIEEKLPTVALLDIQMPGVSGIEVTRLVTRTAPATAVILFSGYGDRAQVVEALDAGARGFLMKNCALAEVLRAVQVVSRGGTYVDAMLSDTSDVPDVAPTITQRDRDVLRLLARGEGYDDIGAALFISSAAARKLMGRIKTKLGASTPTEAVAIALRHSLIT